MKTVKLLTAKKIDDKDYKVYDEVEVDDPIADEWIAAGYAVKVENRLVDHATETTAESDVSIESESIIGNVDETGQD